jgi:hypothetical protein
VSKLRGKNVFSCTIHARSFHLSFLSYCDVAEARSYFASTVRICDALPSRHSTSPYHGTGLWHLDQGGLNWLECSTDWRKTNVQIDRKRKSFSCFDYWRTDTKN